MAVLCTALGGPGLQVGPIGCSPLVWLELTMPLSKRTDYGDAKFAGLVVPFLADLGADGGAVKVRQACPHSHSHPAVRVNAGSALI